MILFNINTLVDVIKLTNYVNSIRNRYRDFVLINPS
jgi:hypothetical protein